MADCLLVHGGVHDRSCWDRLIPALEALGHRAVAIDLPGRGATATRLRTATLDDWTASIAETVEALGTPPLLIGHSMGGVSTSQYAEHRPRTIAGVIYVAAIVPADGASGLSTLAGAGQESVLLREGVWRFSEDGTFATLDGADAAQAFYNRCPPDVTRDAVSRLCPEAVAPPRARLGLGTGFSSVAKTYIGTLDDHVLPLAYQRRMAERAGAAFQTIDADHSPFLCAVDELALQIDDIHKRLRARE